MVYEYLFSFVLSAGSGSSCGFRRLNDMRRLVLIALVLALSATAADARRRHHHHWHGAPVVMINPDMPDADAPREMPRDLRGLDMPREPRRNSSFIPADWKLQPED